MPSHCAPPFTFLMLILVVLILLLLILLQILYYIFNCSRLLIYFFPSENCPQEEAGGELSCSQKWDEHRREQS
jgi:hypothetical protein